uniref:NAC domain-containing protein n=1 Tax=Leersia perrieri TaxID=77586 RepID=A0A0D9VMU5_9ORYZ
MSLSPPDSSAAAVPLAPGFRFHPTDEELVSYYLRRRILGHRLRIDAIAEVDLYRLEPWDLPSLSRIRSRDAQWYFFARLDRKVTGAGAGGRGGPGNRTNRATPRGYWKTTGKDRDVHHRGKLVGMKKTLVFHSGRAPKGERTNWVMHEYRLLDANGAQDLHVVCRIFQKMGSGPQNGAQYGAPYLEEDWEEEDDAIENAPASGASTEIAAVADTADEESNEDDEKFSFKANELLEETQEDINQPEMTPVKAQDLRETNGSGYGDDVFSLDEILQEPENVCKNEEQNAIDDNFTIEELSGYPRQDDVYVGENGPVNWVGPSNGDNANWPLRAYSTQNHVNGTLSADGFFDTGNDTSSYSGQQQFCPSDNQNMYLQDDGMTASRQVDDSMPFFDASSNHKWVDGKDDYVNLNDLLYQPTENQSLFDVGDDLMAYFDANEDDFKLDIMGTEGNSELPDMSNFVQKDDNKEKFTLDGMSNSTLYGASSSGSHGNMYPDTAVPDMPMDDTLDKSFGKRLASMLGSIPAPPAMASELPPSTGKSLGVVNPNSSIHVTAGIIQLGGLTFTGSTEHLQKNGDFNLLFSFTVEGDVSSKSIDFEPVTRMSTAPIVLRSGMYLFFVSAMILMLSYKVGLCIYSR